VIEEELEAYFDRLWPLLRSITGDGVRQTHGILGELLPLTRFEIPTGTEVFDWTVPPEWVVREAYVAAPDGQRLLDVHENNLHLVNYSAPFRGRLSRRELEQYLYSRPDLPQAVPYVTSYYDRRWGFCISHDDRLRLPEGDYDIVVDTDLIDGSLTISEAVLPGETPQEILISTYTCHPSLANNELSGPLVAAFLYRQLAALEARRLTYRFVFLPETIGSVAYLAMRGDHLLERLVAGYVVTCVGDAGPFTYKRSRRRNSIADRAALHCLRRWPEARIVDFFPSGSDERQYCSPGFDLPVGSIMRTMYGKYPEYHTSLDDKSLISFAAMRETIELYARTCRVIDRNRSYVSLKPLGEPQLGKRGLYPTIGGQAGTERIEALLWLLNYSDGKHDLLAIADRSGIDFEVLAEAADKCIEHRLLQALDEERSGPAHASRISPS
jgi:aminopeptidase-like protein